MTNAGGADGEKTTTVYITYNPSTGQATASKMPGVEAASTTPGQAALLVSSDRRWAIPDTVIPAAEGKSGQLKVYSPADGTTKVIDIHQRTGDDSVVAVGWAFDPKRPDTLRVVDSKNRIWAVSVSGDKATQEGSLPKGGPWIFTNGFNPNTGEPWLESIDSDATKPAGNGAADTSPVTPFRRHRAGLRLRRARQAAAEPVPPRRRVHRRERRHLGLLRRQADPHHLLPA